MKLKLHGIVIIIFFSCFFVNEAFTMKTIKNDFTKRQQYLAAPEAIKIIGETTLTVPPRSNNNYLCDTDNGPFTVTLPAGTDDDYARIINAGTSGNILTIAPDGSELIIGENSGFKLYDGEALILIYESTEGWY